MEACVQKWWNVAEAWLIVDTTYKKGIKSGEWKVVAMSLDVG